jgi:predicted phosphodiesterase
MIPVEISLPMDMKELEILIFSDEHIGDPHCDIESIQKRIDYVKDTPNCYVILGGDIIDNATKTSVGDIYTQTMSPMEQLDYVEAMFKPIKNKILCSVLGNHENRTYKKEGIDPMRCLCDRLGCANKYSTTGVVLFLKFGKDVRYNRKIVYTIYVTHGSGGGRKEGAKAIRLADLASIVDCDIYCHNHTHLPMIMKEDYFRTDIQNRTIKQVTKLFVNSAASLRYGGYGESMGCKPASIDSPKIILSGVTKEAKAIL